MKSVRNPLLLILALTATRAFAQESTPAPVASPAPAAPVAPVSPAVSARTAKPAAAAKPSASATKPAEGAEAARPTGVQIDKVKAMVEELRAAAEFQTAQAARKQARGEIATAESGEIRRARERATDHVTVQMQRIEKTMESVALGKADVHELREEIEGLAHVAEEGSDAIAAIRTHNDSTEEALQEIAGCFEDLGEVAEGIESELEGAGSKDREVEITINDEGDTIRIRAGDGDRVSYGEPVEIKLGQTVNDAVSILNRVIVNGTVRGDAVAILEDVHIGKTGRVEGDAAAIGGRVIVEEGGHVGGDRVSVGAGVLLEPFKPHPIATMPVRAGFGLLGAGAKFLCFFLLGLLVMTVAPRRTQVVADALAAHPVKSGGFGALATLLWLPLTLLLGITIIGIPLIPLFWLLYVVAAFFGYVALALLIGRRIPRTTSVSSTAAFLALGAGAIVFFGLAVHLLLPAPLKLLAWMIVGFFPLGAALMTRFGQERGTTGPDASAGLTPAA